MNKKKIVFVVGGILGVMIVLGLTSLNIFLCETTKVAKYNSPTGSYTVSQTIKACGATTDFVTRLNVGVLNREIIAIKGAHENDLYVKWVDNRNIIVNYIGDPEKIYNYKTEISGIKVQYKNGDKNLEIKCLYTECEAISRAKEIERRKEWCSYSSDNREYCNKNPGWETCDDLTWCHYNGPNK